MACSKCNKEVSEEGKCVACGLLPEECTCPVVEETAEAEAAEESAPAEESPSSEEPAEEKNI